jgi:hypothetical protein
VATVSKNEWKPPKVFIKSSRKSEADGNHPCPVAGMVVGGKQNKNQKETMTNSSSAEVSKMQRAIINGERQAEKCRAGKYAKTCRYERSDGGMAEATEPCCDALRAVFRGIRMNNYAPEVAR